MVSEKMRPIVRNTVGGGAAEEQPGFGVGLSRTPFLNRNAKSARGRAVLQSRCAESSCRKDKAPREGANDH